MKILQFLCLIHGHLKRSYPLLLEGIQVLKIYTFTNYVC